MMKKWEISEYSVKYLQKRDWKARVYEACGRALQKWKEPVQGVDTHAELLDTLHVCLMQKWKEPVQGVDTFPAVIAELVVHDLQKWKEPVQGVDTLPVSDGHDQTQQKWKEPVQGVDTLINSIMSFSLSLQKWKEPVQGVDTLQELLAQAESSEQQKWKEPVQGVDTGHNLLIYPEFRYLSRNGKSPFRALTHVSGHTKHDVL